MKSRHLLAWLFALAPLSLVAVACSSDSAAGGSSGDGGYGCSQAPNCSGCQQCFDTCLCNGGDAQGCLAQCTGGGGTGGGGTGGAGPGGAPAGGAGGGGPSCTQLSTGKPGCDACAHASCCSQIDACFANPDCLGFLSCLSKNCASAGANLNACAQQFCSQYANGINAYNAVSQCIGQSCAGSC